MPTMSRCATRSYGPLGEKGVLPALRAAITACDIAITLRLERAVPGVIAGCIGPDISSGESAPPLHDRLSECVLSRPDRSASCVLNVCLKGKEDCGGAVNCGRR